MILRPLLLLCFLGLAPLSCFAQKLQLLGGYTRVGEASFTGALSAGLQATFPIGRHLVGGVGFRAARNRQDYQEFILGLPGEVGRTITVYHNFLYSLHGFVGGHIAVSQHLEATLGPSAGLYVVGSRERADEVRLGFGLWSGLSYAIPNSRRFGLEAVFHPRLLLPNIPAEDVSFRFDGRRLFTWDTQVGISYQLRKQP
ncbi:hypothetical protein [Hymenobacter canadensis]|uniref:Outer membrane protein beta-barrel domain-containing protein n=1 Tax=Hymenobacter canadensis TaxID=2999067 RepID=A0ABY7LSF3_9BACT|nr:hypothetical protein [Hymenobacter canadensis]WBA43340.1 hypothetical protein O3303_07170 [Hymenobacter canadensis]